MATQSTTASESRHSVQKSVQPTASQVCRTCKGRKKKCDKRLPQCSYCEQKQLECCYEYAHGDLSPHILTQLQVDKKTRHPTPQAFATGDLKLPIWATTHSQSTPSAHSVPIASILGDVPLDTTIALEVTRIIDATHQTIDDIGVRYFNGHHLWVPFLCPDRFRKDVIQSRQTPTAEFSVFLLCLCLITYDPPKHCPPPIGHDRLYLHSKTLLTQVAVLRRPSVHLIQAGILVSTYEYAHGRPDSALSSIDFCVRLAYKAGIHQKPERAGWSESWNTWWALRIFERIFYCETSLNELPLVSSSPDEADYLPSEVGDPESDGMFDPSCRVGPVCLVGVGCLGRAAQAAYLLDRVLQAMRNIPPTSQISSLIALDSELQRLLSATMKKCHGTRGGHCGAVGVSIRALFILHEHILHLNTISIASQWRKHSQAALHTAAQMVVDIARSHREIHGTQIDIISPVCNYVVRHALKHIYDERYTDSTAWFEDSDTLRQSLEKLEGRWPVEPGLFSEY